MNGRRGEYLHCETHELGMCMYFRYRGEVYSVIRAFTYPMTEYEQHQIEQDKIDNKLDKPKSQSSGHNAKEDLAKFFKLIEEGDSE